jgi:hypothetical protein
VSTPRCTMPAAILKAGKYCHTKQPAATIDRTRTGLRAQIAAETRRNAIGAQKNDVNRSKPDSRHKVMETTTRPSINGTGQTKLQKRVAASGVVA